MQQFPVYVPNPAAPAVDAAVIAHVDAKSAIVGECLPASGATGLDDDLRIYYEGNRYRFAGMITFADRAQRACERLRERAPTIATSLAPKRALTHVGCFTFGHGVDVEGATELIALARWLGLFDNDQLQSARLHAELRLSNGTPASRLRATMRAAEGQDRPIGELSPRELGRGLMRGSRAELKAGYSAEHAAKAVQHLHRLPAEELLALRAYLIGFSHGLCDTSGPLALQVLQTSIPEARGQEALVRAHDEGFDHGAAEDPRRTLPAR